MTSHFLEFFIESDFTIDHVTEMSWTTNFFTRCLHQFRWSGLSGVELEEGELRVINSIVVNDTSINMDDHSGILESFIIVQVCKPSMETTAMFAIPVLVEINRADTFSVPAEIDLLGVFHFQNEVVSTVQISTRNPQFWKDACQLMLSNDYSNKDLEMTFLDPVFQAIISNGVILGESDLEVSFLGDNDTTNIVMRFKIESSPDLDFILKFYPRIQFNTARFLNDMLSSSDFGSFARIMAACDYQREFVHEIFNITGQESFYEDVVAGIVQLNKEASIFYPFIHIFKFIHGNSDGGAPFWNSAIGLFNEMDSDANVDTILELAKKLGISVAKFHGALGSRTDNPAFIKSQRSKMIAKIKDQLRVACTFLKENNEITGLPDLFSSARSWLIRMMDFTLISKQLIPPENQFTEAPRQYIHQDLHMGQFIFMEQEQEFIVLDLEGDPQIPWYERVDLYHVEKDIASLVRSLSYIKIAALKNVFENIFHLEVSNETVFSFLHPLLFLLEHDSINVLEILFPIADQAFLDRLSGIIEALNNWEAKMGAMIVASYQEFHQLNPQLLHFYTLQRILNEISYEIKFRPGNFFIPLIGIIELLHQNRG